MGKQLVFLMLILVVSAVLFALLAEGAVRVRQRLKHGSAAPLDHTFRIDPLSGLRVPAADKVPSQIKINSLGFRGPEIESPKPPGTIRLAFLGASTTYCAEASGNDTTWPELVWRAVSQARPGARFDYLNAAVSGYSTASSLKNLDYRVRPLGPDVIVAYEGFNDLSYDTAALARRQGLRAGARDEESWLSRHSMLWFLVEKNVTIWRLQTQDNARGQTLSPDFEELSRGFEQRLSELVAASQQVAPVVAIATMAPRLRRVQAPDEQRRAAVTARYYMPYLSIDAILDAYDAYNRAIRRVAARRGAVLIEASDAVAPDSTHYADSVHFTDAGSQSMAERVSSVLLSSRSFERLLTTREKGATTSRP